MDSKEWRRWLRSSILAWLVILLKTPKNEQTLRRGAQQMIRGRLRLWLHSFVWEGMLTHLSLLGLLLVLALLNWGVGKASGFYPIDSFFATLKTDYLTKQPNRFDLWFGVLLGTILTTLILFLAVGRENRRFRKDFTGGGGPQGDIRLPLSRKVIRLDEFRARRQGRQDPSEGPKPSAALG